MVKRYDFELARDEYDPSPYIRADENPDGEHVQYTDYAALAERCEMLEARISQLVSALDQAACDLSVAGQSLAEFEGFQFRMNDAIEKTFAASKRAHDANGYKEYP